jgi:Uma2 family endonuclease
MKAVMPSVPVHVLEWRRRTGADRYDEMWDGVLHMPPVPSRDHQDLEWSLETWLRLRWAPPCGARVYHQINVARPGRWPQDYRIPDLVLLTPARFGIDRDQYFDGGPEVVVEIRSPGDETDDKLPFYADIGVLEVWVIDREAKTPHVLVLEGDGWVEAAPDAEGWVKSRFAGVELQARDRKLAVRLAGEPASEAVFPDWP